MIEIGIFIILFSIGSWAAFRFGKEVGCNATLEILENTGVIRTYDKGTEKEEVYSGSHFPPGWQMTLKKMEESK